jgi:hypothetical protein
MYNVCCPLYRCWGGREPAETKESRHACPIPWLWGTLPCHFIPLWSWGSLDTVCCHHLGQPVLYGQLGLTGPGMLDLIQWQERCRLLNSQLVAAKLVFKEVNDGPTHSIHDTWLWCINWNSWVNVCTDALVSWSESVNITKFAISWLTAKVFICYSM